MFASKLRLSSSGWPVIGQKCTLPAERMGYPPLVNEHSSNAKTACEEQSNNPSMVAFVEASEVAFLLVRRARGCFDVAACGVLGSCTS
jgi:hypothetical protein